MEIFFSFCLVLSGRQIASNALTAMDTFTHYLIYYKAYLGKMEYLKTKKRTESALISAAVC